MSSAPLSGRSLERTFAVSTALLVLVLMGSTMLAVRGRVASSLSAGLEARGESVARSIASVTTPSLFAYNYPALQMAAEGASADPGVVYVAIHDKEGNLAGVAGHTPGGALRASIGPIRGGGPIDSPRSKSSARGKRPRRRSRSRFRFTSKGFRNRGASSGSAFPSLRWPPTSGRRCST